MTHVADQSDSDALWRIGEVVRMPVSPYGTQPAARGIIVGHNFWAPVYGRSERDTGKLCDMSVTTSKVPLTTAFTSPPAATPNSRAVSSSIRPSSSPLLPISILMTLLFPSRMLTGDPRMARHPMRPTKMMRSPWRVFGRCLATSPSVAVVSHHLWLRSSG